MNRGTSSLEPITEVVKGVPTKDNCWKKTSSYHLRTDLRSIRKKKGEGVSANEQKSGQKSSGTKQILLLATLRGDNKETPGLGLEGETEGEGERNQSGDEPV